MALMPIWLTNLFSVLLGLVFGSFATVLVARLPSHSSIVMPGSRCPGCQTALRWWNNIPVFSYLFQRGRCSTCKTKISIRYPVIELMMAALFLAVRLKYGFNWLVFVRDWPFIVLLVTITFIDLEHRIIPDSLSLGGLALGLATAWFVPGLGLQSSFLGALIGFAVFYTLAWVYQLKTGRSGLGGGDIKLIAMLGAFVGPMGVFATILISSIVGSVVGITWGMMSRQKNIMAVAIPYGPFLIIGGLYYYLLGDLLWFQFMTPT